VRPAIVEAFTERRVWVLGVASRLDFDTRLAPFEPTGLQVPDPAGQSCPPGPIGAAVVGASGPLQEYQIGLPLFSDAAYRFCVVVDACRVGEAGLLEELRRIVEREKPAHTDYRIEIVAPELRIGLQARIGIDAIVGEPRAGGLDTIRLGFDSLLPRADAARAGDARLDGSLTLTKGGFPCTRTTTPKRCCAYWPRRAAISSFTASEWTCSTSAWSRTTAGSSSGSSID
jgi:hypothetical protein